MSVTRIRMPRMHGPPQEFESDWRMVIESVNKLGSRSGNHNCLYHPMFGKMTAKQWAVIAHKHIDHHRKQFGA